MRYVRNKLKGLRNKTAILTDVKTDNIEFDRFLLTREGKDPEIVRRHWERTAKYLYMIKDLLDQHGIRFVLVVYPYGHQVGERQWEKGRSYWAFDSNRTYDPSAAMGMVQGLARGKGIILINVYDALRQNKDEKLYFTGDGHFTPVANRIVAKAIVDDDAFRDMLDAAPGKGVDRVKGRDSKP